MSVSLSQFAPDSYLVSRDGFGSPVLRQPAHLHNTQAESGACLRDSSRVPRRRSFIYLKPPYAIGSVPSLSGRAIAYRWRSLPRVHRHRVSSLQGSSKRLLPWPVTMDQLICASLSHTHYWYEVGMLKVPAFNAVYIMLLLVVLYSTSVRGSQSTINNQSIILLTRERSSVCGVWCVVCRYHLLTADYAN